MGRNQISKNEVNMSIKLTIAVQKLEKQVAELQKQVEELKKKDPKQAGKGSK